MEKIVKFFRDEDGLELSEYAVMGALIIVALVTAVGLLSDQIIVVIDAITDRNYCSKL